MKGIRVQSRSSLTRKTVRLRGRTLFIDLKERTWTFIVLDWRPQQRSNVHDRTELWGAFP